MSIRWITDKLGTAPASAIENEPGISIVDVRDLVDKEGNQPDSVRKKIQHGVDLLNEGRKTVVCCDYGISRSNAIAAGILAAHEKISLISAIRRVQDSTGETEIKLAPLEVVRQALKEDNKVRDDKKLTILVTGANGFIGSATCARLEENFDVVRLSRNDTDLETGNTQLSLIASERQVSAIIHLASPRVFTSNAALGKTLSMLRNVLEVCVGQNIHLTYLSGWEVYSGYAGSVLADESLPLFPRGPYGEAKYLAEMMIAHWERTTPLQCALLRSSPVYGPQSSKPKLIYNFIEKAKRSEAIVTHRYQNGDPMLDLLHIDDMSTAISTAVQRKFSGQLNLGTGTVTSTPRIAELIRELLGSESPIEHTKIHGATPCIAMNNKRAANALDWEPRIELSSGLKSLIFQKS